MLQINILAARTVASLLKTSLGPKGMDKMLVSPDGEVIITNDGATILEKMEVSALSHFASFPAVEAILNFKILNFYEFLPFYSRSIIRQPNYWSNYPPPKITRSAMEPLA